LVTNQWEAIRTAAGLLLKRHPRGVVVDCSGIRKVSDEGAQTFYDMMVYIESKKARIIVANVPAHVKEALSDIPDVRSRLAMAGSVADARKSLDLLDEITKPRKGEQRSTGKLLLCLAGSPADSHALSLAAAIAERRHLSVVATFPIAVPRALPTNTPMPEEEQIATQSLTRVREFLSQKGIEVQLSVDRTRSIVSVIESMQEGAMVCVISLPAPDPAKGEPANLINALLGIVKPEIVLVREPLRQMG
jgi:hypothetical protein